LEVYCCIINFANDSNNFPGEILGTLEGSSRGRVVGVFWKNVVGGIVFVYTWGYGWYVLIGDREEKEWNGRLMIETHYYLMNLPSSIFGDETIEMSGGGGRVGGLDCGGIYRFG